MALKLIRHVTTVAATDLADDIDKYDNNEPPKQGGNDNE